jgi:hypothetical protein
MKLKFNKNIIFIHYTTIWQFLLGCPRTLWTALVFPSTCRQGKYITFDFANIGLKCDIILEWRIIITASYTFFRVQYLNDFAISPINWSYNKTITVIFFSQYMYNDLATLEVKHSPCPLGSLNIVLLR